MFGERVFAALLVFAAASSILFGAGCVSQTPPEKAMSLARQHREAEGVATLRAHLTAHPGDLASRRLLVRLLAFSGDLDAARREVYELASRVPEGDPTPWLELGHAFELAHKFEEALAAYDTAAKLAPASPAGPREGGMRCARWGEIEEALPRLEEAVRRGARDAEIWHALGLVRLHGHDLDGAEEAYRAGDAADPKGAENLLGIASVAVVRGDAVQALAAYDALLVRRPRLAAAELGRAWALAKLNRTDDARHALDHAEQLGAPKENLEKQRAALTKAPN